MSPMPAITLPRINLDLFAIVEPRNPSIAVSELHEVTDRLILRL